MIHLHSNGTCQAGPGWAWVGSAPGDGGGWHWAAPHPPAGDALLCRTADIFQVGECRRVQRLAVSPTAGLLVVLCGRGPSVRLFALAELESTEVAGAKIPESRGCQVLAAGRILQARTPVLCVAVKRQVLCYQLGPGPGPWQHRIRELQAPAPVQSLGLLGDRLCVGAAGAFALYPLLNEAAPLALGADLVPEELPPSRGGLGEALGAVELSLNEFLLLFTTAGVYVDGAGRKSRIHELLWPAVPTGWGKACGGPGWVGPGTCGVSPTSEEDRLLPKLLRVALEASVYPPARPHPAMPSVACVHLPRPCLVPALPLTQLLSFSYVANS